MGEKIDHHMSVGRHHNKKIQQRRNSVKRQRRHKRASRVPTRRQLVIRQRPVETTVDNDAADLADLDQEINAMLSDDNNEVMEQLAAN